MRDHKVGCPRLQCWDAGEWEVPCICDDEEDEMTYQERLDKIDNFNQVDKAYGVQTYTYGMSLHQWYVGMAISGLASDFRTSVTDIAKTAIQIADTTIAMLAERSKTDD